MRVHSRARSRRLEHAPRRRRLAGQAGGAQRPPGPRRTHPKAKGPQIVVNSKSNCYLGQLTFPAAAPVQMLLVAVLHRRAGWAAVATLPQLVCLSGTTKPRYASARGGIRQQGSMNATGDSVDGANGVEARQPLRHAWLCARHCEGKTRGTASSKASRRCPRPRCGRGVASGGAKARAGRALGPRLPAGCGPARGLYSLKGRLFSDRLGIARDCSIENIITELYTPKRRMARRGRGRAASAATVSEDLGR